MSKFTNRKTACWLIVYWVCLYVSLSTWQWIHQLKNWLNGWPVYLSIYFLSQFTNHRSVCSREQTKIPRFMLEGPQPCTIFCFALIHYCMNDVTNTFLLVSSSVWSTQLLCFVHSQVQKREQKHTTKNFVGFHNHSPPLTMVCWSVSLWISLSVCQSRNQLINKWAPQTVGQNISLSICKSAWQSVLCFFDWLVGLSVCNNYLSIQSLESFLCQ